MTYDYTRGLLTKLTRNTNGQNQVYNLSYDTLGNLTKMQVGSRTLMTYTYGAKNGPLERQTYGNGAYTEYEYDSLGRASRTSTSDGDTYTYRYTGDGQLYEMKDSNGGEEITYRYQYDSIGRLIGTTQSGGTAELQAMYQYDSNNRLTRMNYSIPGIVDSGEESFYYNGDGSGMVADLKNASEGVLKGMALFSNSWILYEYDELSRLSRRRVGEVLEEHYSYLPGSESGTTTTLPETYYTTAKGSSTKLSGYRYAYDARNNITRITDLKNNSYWSYAYDEVGQLRYATTYNASGVAQDRYKYTYNRAGNLTEWKIQNGDNTETYEEHTYTYGNSEWKDLLTAFDGHTITYDVNGNPLSYYNGKSYSMSWRNGRELEQVKVGGKTYRYEYDGNGQRTRKSNEDGGYTEYYLVDGLAVAERRYYASGSERYTMRYLYDECNSPVGLGLKYPGESLWTYFYFEKNVQGDVIGLYRSDYSSSRGYYGTLVARYSYDPYGRPVSMTNASGTTISQTAYNVAAYNPFRYRGYRYDGETGLYYLQSRYYDPETCRFINADKFMATGDGILNYNMFAYCGNNPINLSDPEGEIAGIAIFGVLVSAVVGAVVSGINTAMSGGSAGEIASSAAIGGITGGAIALAAAAEIAVGTAALIGGAIGAAGEIVSQGVSYAFHKDDPGYEFNWTSAGAKVIHAAGMGALGGVVSRGINNIFKTDEVAGFFISDEAAVAIGAVDFGVRTGIDAVTSNSSTSPGRTSQSRSSRGGGGNGHARVALCLQ